MMTSERYLKFLYGVIVALSAISLIVYVPRQGMSVIAVVIVSFFLGFATKAGYLRVRGQQVRVPIIERSRATFSLLVIVMLTLALVSVFQVQRVVDTSEDCNRQFRTALTYNAGINREDTALRDERDSELSRRRDAQDRLIATLGPDGRANEVALTQYRGVVDSVEKRLKDLDGRRMEAQRTRAPYPAPTCGIS